MNTQPSEFFSGLIALILILGMMFYFLSCDWKISDKFTVGYIDRQPQEQPPVYVSVINEAPKQKPKDKIDRKLFIDCVNVMISLGHKKTLATQKTKQIFNEDNPKNIQEFIDIAFRKGD
jgi:hypothetical protein